MNFFKKSSIVLFLTLVLIVSSLTVFAEEKKEIKIMISEDEEMNQMKMDMPDMMHGGKFGMNMYMFLDLTEEQEKKIHEMKIALKKDIIDISAKIEKTNIDFNELVLNNANAKTLIKKMEDIGKMKMDIEKKKIEAFVKIRQMMNKEQIEVLNKIGIKIFENKHKMIMEKHTIDGKNMKFKEMEGKGKYMYKNRDDCDDCDDCDEGK